MPLRWFLRAVAIAASVGGIGCAHYVTWVDGSRDATVQCPVPGDSAPGTIRLSFNDQGGQPIPGVYVVAKSPAGETGATAGIDGKALVRVGAGKVMLKATLSGFHPVEVSALSLAPGCSADIAVEMEIADRGHCTGSGDLPCI